MKKFCFAFLALALGAWTALSGAILTVTNSGNQVDASGGQTIDNIASGSPSLSTFNAQSDLVVVSEWTGASGLTDILLLANGPDVRILSPRSLHTDLRDSGLAYQSTPSSENFAWAGSNGQQLVIEFGTWNGSSFTPDQSVQSAGFTILNMGGAYTQARAGNTPTIRYLDANGNVLSQQLLEGSPDANDPGTGGDGFSGFIAASEGIARIEMDFYRESGESDIGLDDLALRSTPTPGNLTWSNPTISVPRDQAFATLVVERRGGSLGEITVQVNTQPGTALEGIDFLPVSETLIWPAGDTSPRSVSIPLTGIPSSEGKVFTILLSSPTGGAVLNSPSTATVDITAPVGNGLATALSLYLPLDNPFRDISEYQLNTDLTGASPSPNGWSAGALAFDGSGDRLVVDPWSYETDLPDRSAVSISLRFQADTTSGSRVLFDDPVKKDALGARIASGNLMVTCTRNGRKVTLSTPFSDTSSWHHLLVVKNGDTLTVFLNGNAVASVPDLNSAPASSVDAGSGDAFFGRIDDVRFYHRALSPAEATGLANAPALGEGEIWRGHHFQTTLNAGDAANLADPDQDGSPNLLERAFGTDPLLASDHFSPVLSDNNGTLRFSFIQQKDPLNHAAWDETRRGLIYRLRQSSRLDPASWTTSPTILSISREDLSPTLEKVFLSLPTLPPATQSFWQLGVESVGP